eukprot:13091305-Alexandrium_andersonii.AAC.1
MGESFDQGQREQLFLQADEGGMGLGPAYLRHDAAYLAAWEGGVLPAAAQLEVATHAALEALLP